MLGKGLFSILGGLFCFVLSGLGVAVGWVDSTHKVCQQGMERVLCDAVAVKGQQCPTVGFRNPVCIHAFTQVSMAMNKMAQEARNGEGSENWNSAWKVRSLPL